jgi:hypothetical protein
MRGQMRVAGIRAVLLAAALLSGAHPLHSQGVESWKVHAISTVMDYRASVLADATAKFDGCSLAQHLGDHAVVRVQLAEQVRWMLAPCESAAAMVDRHVVRLDSLSRGETEVRVHLTVIRSEWIHGEEFILIPTEAIRPYMLVREVRLSGGSQFYPVRPRRAPASP